MRRKISIWIYDDLPIPKKIRSFPVMKHPLHQMLKQLEVGQALDWPRELKETPIKLRAVMQRHGKATGKKFKFRTCYPSGNLTYRIWRIA